MLTKIRDGWSKGPPGEAVHLPPMLTGPAASFAIPLLGAAPTTQHSAAATQDGLLMKADPESVPSSVTIDV